MKSNKINIYNVLGAVILMLTLFFVGVYRDTEFYEPQLFVKDQPTTKFHFYSPTGQSDLTIKDLNPEKQTEELAFQDYVERNAISQFWGLPYILIQLTLTSLSLGIFYRKHKAVFDVRILLKHFALAIILTSSGIAAILYFDTLIAAVLGGSAVLMSNFIISYFLIANR